MADPLPIEPGAPVPRGSIDPELVRLSRPQPKVGLITAAGLVFLCGYFVVRLTPDRHFAASPSGPQKVTPAEVADGKVPIDRYVQLETAQPLWAQAIRTATSPGSLGLRTAPIRASGDRVWIAMPGDGWERPGLGVYVGRLRRLSDLPFAASIAAFSQRQARLSFATAEAVRAGFKTGTVRDVSGDPIAANDSTRVAFEVVDSTMAVVVGTKNDRLPSAEAWAAALQAAGIIAVGEPQIGDHAVRIRVAIDNGLAGLNTKLQASKLWAARGEPVTHHYDTTWADLKRSPPTGFAIGETLVPNDQLDLVGLYVARAIPSGAYVVLVGEQPDDYWYVQPITICLAALGVLFGFALFRAVKRDLLPTAA